jgi:asparagine synthetase B (glutamine-hydrolysing)
LHRQVDEPARFPLPDFPVPAPIDAPYAEAVQRVRATILDAVEDAVRPARRVAVLFSGGTDSSAVAAALGHVWRRLDRDPADLGLVHLRSQPDEPGPEEPWAAHTARHLGLPFHAYGAAWPEDPFSTVEDFLRANDRPPDDGGFLSGRWEYEHVRSLGFDTVLTGDGGGEVFAGWWMRPWRTRSPWGTGCRLAEHALRAVARATRQVVTGPPGTWRRKVRALSVPAWLAASCPDRADARTYPQPRAGLPRGHVRRERTTWCARQMVVLSWWDAWGEVTGLRFRTPLLDRRLLDLAVALPPAHFLPDPRDRRLLRDAFREDLPPAAAARPKDPTSAQRGLRDDLTAHGVAWMDRHVRGSILDTSGLAPWRDVEAWTRTVAAGRSDDVYRAYGLAGLGAWCGARDLRATAS